MLDLLALLLWPGGTGTTGPALDLLISDTALVVDDGGTAMACDAGATAMTADAGATGLTPD